jgi:hypothetical protein
MLRFKIGGIGRIGGVFEYRSSGAKTFLRSPSIDEFVTSESTYLIENVQAHEVVFSWGKSAIALVAIPVAYLP